MKIEVLQIKEDWRIIKLNKIHDSVFDPKHDQKFLNETFDKIWI